MENSPGYSSTRASESFIKVAGKGNHNSDQFELRNGLYIAKVNHTGKSHCGIKLLYGDGKLAQVITNEIGRVFESRAIRIDEDGYYLLDVSADGDWIVSMEYQKPKTINQEDATSENLQTQATDSTGSTDPVVIKLKNGRILNTDSYWESEGKLKVSIYGGIMTMDKNDVQEIISPPPESPTFDDLKTNPPEEKIRQLQRKIDGTEKAH